MTEKQLPFTALVFAFVSLHSMEENNARTSLEITQDITAPVWQRFHEQDRQAQYRVLSRRMRSRPQDVLHNLVTQQKNDHPHPLSQLEECLCEANRIYAPRLRTIGDRELAEALVRAARNNHGHVIYADVGSGGLFSTAVIVAHALNTASIKKLELHLIDPCYGTYINLCTKTTPSQLTDETYRQITLQLLEEQERYAFFPQDPRSDEQIAHWTRKIKANVQLCHAQVQQLLAWTRYHCNQHTAECHILLHPNTDEYLKELQVRHYKAPNVVSLIDPAPDLAPFMLFDYFRLLAHSNPQPERGLVLLRNGRRILDLWKNNSYAPNVWIHPLSWVPHFKGPAEDWAQYWFANMSKNRKEALTYLQDASKQSLVKKYHVTERSPYSGRISDMLTRTSFWATILCGATWGAILFKELKPHQEFTPRLIMHS